MKKTVILYLITNMLIFVSTAFGHNHISLRNPAGDLTSKASSKVPMSDKYFYSIPQEGDRDFPYSIYWPYRVPECQFLQKLNIYESSVCTSFEKHQSCVTEVKVKLYNSAINMEKDFVLINQVFETESDCKADRNRYLESGE